MTSGLADLDPYYDLDLRATALRDTRIVEPPGQRFRYNNVNPILLGMVLERVTGETVSAYLSERLWGPLGMEADGSWSLDRRRSGLELLQAGLNGRAIDFAKLGALYLHQGAWQGRQLVPAAGSPTRPGPTPAPTPRQRSSTTGGPGLAPARPTTSGPRATTASSSTSPPAATWSWSGSGSTTTTTTGPICWPRSPAAYEPARSRRN
jgi:CubicO group peptidase (beta-lactamase class C family)